MNTLRILDAAANRAREALRVLEDAARFAWNDQPLTAQLKNLRHDLAAALALLPMGAALQQRDTPADVGTSLSTPAEFHRPALTDIIVANAKRLTEALRSLEEFAKPHHIAAAAQLEQIRYRAYSLEQSLIHTALAQDAATRFRHVRLYVLLTESLCTKPWETTLDEILAAVPGPTPPLNVTAGDISGTPMPPLAIQLREKNLPDAELIRRAHIVVKKCRNANALAIINDRPDIALLSNAHGIHVGQTDLCIKDCRQLLGPQAIIGISTENLDQARAAQEQSPTYLALGPMFPTTTKEKPRIAGPAYAAAAVQEFPQTPLVAIGGITLENVKLVLDTGVRCMAVSGMILRSEQPGERVKQILKMLNAQS